MKRSLAGLAVLVGVVLAAPPAAADWLVLQDGTRIETQGEWQVKGRLVVFTAASGELASLRSNEVDLAASEEATASAVRAAEEKLKEATRPADPRPSRPPVLVLTDEDVQHVEPELEEAAGGDAAGATQRRLTVLSWEQEESPDGQGVMVVGSLRNDGANVATSIQVQVQIVDSEGAIVGTQPAQLTASSLGTGEVLNFRAHFPEVVGFDTARFDVTSREFIPAPPVNPDGSPAEDDFEEEPELDGPEA